MKTYRLLQVCVYSSNHGALYTIVIGLTRRMQKVQALRMSVCSYYYDTCLVTSSLIINSIRIILMLGESALCPLQENEAEF